MEANFEGGPGIPLSNFRRLPGTTFKLLGCPGSRVLGSRGPGFWGPGLPFTPCRRDIVPKQRYDRFPPTGDHINASTTSEHAWATPGHTTVGGS